MKKIVENYGGIIFFYLVLLVGIIVLNNVTFKQGSSEIFSVSQIES